MTPESDLAARAEIARLDALSTHHDVVHEGVRVRWRRFGGSDSGSGNAQSPLVLLHGGHGSWLHWARNIEALCATRTLWLPDMPGFLDSDVPPRPAEGDDPLGPLLAALGGTLDALIGAGTPIDLGGFSFGGLVAARFAVQRGNVRRLALLGSGGHGTLRRLTVEMINWRAAGSRAEEIAALRHNLAALMLHDPTALDALAFEIHDISCHGTRFRSKDVSLAGGLQQALDALDLRGVPQLLLWGAYDVTGDPQPLVAELTAGHPLRQGAVIEDGGHWVQYERATQTHARLLDFLA
ncbi:pimeloyl-ACP methyl ester carboxylesterase [Variovorax ginsengisoli]|uniref:Pimeloyl-ACP methyl ester carboxylesterase n=1 Tax=Variovorax ginsengisoli TaxID=363844 RepID=A0ABT9SCQ9_9BURK|nr:pimeloyl-ACP methyl ester carboxylesterase [Variovorax ginsengisoli]